MKIKLALIPAFLLAVASAKADVTFDFFDNAALFDGETSVDVLLSDVIGDTTMTVTGFGGTLNSNSTSFGVGDSAIDGTGESITLVFTTDIEVTLIDFSTIGSDVSDGALLTIGSLSFELYTDNPAVDPVFSGQTDEFLPQAPIALSAGELITFTGTSATSSYDLDSISLNVVPEPGSFALLAGIAGMALAATRRRRT